MVLAMSVCLDTLVSLGSLTSNRLVPDCNIQCVPRILILYINSLKLKTKQTD